MTDSERISLIAEVYELVLDSTDTFYGAVGGDLAYLLGAISKGTVAEFSTRSHIWKILMEHFGSTKRLDVITPFIAAKEE